MVIQHIARGGSAQHVVVPRRGFLKGLVGVIAAPAVVRAEALMPIKVWTPPRGPLEIWNAPISEWTEAEWRIMQDLGICID